MKIKNESSYKKSAVELVFGKNRGLVRRSLVFDMSHNKSNKYLVTEFYTMPWRKLSANLIIGGHVKSFRV